MLLLLPINQCASFKITERSTPLKKGNKGRERVGIREEENRKARRQVQMKTKQDKSEHQLLYQGRWWLLKRLMKEAQEIDQRREAKYCVGTITPSHVSAHTHTHTHTLSKTTDHPNITCFILHIWQPWLVSLACLFCLSSAWKGSPREAEGEEERGKQLFKREFSD